MKGYIADLVKSKRPGILVGGGARSASRIIETFAYTYSIPCFRTWNAQDIITDDMPVYAGTVGTFGGPGRNFGIQNCDLLLSLGCRMSGRITGGLPETFARGAKKYIVDIDPITLDPKLQQVKGDVNVLSDCGEFLLKREPFPMHFHSWLLQCREWVRKYDPVTKEMLEADYLHHYAFMRRLSEKLPSDSVIVSDTGGSVIMMGHAFRSKRGQRIFTSNGNTPMGFSMCGAIGAWFADPSRPVICIIGDGGMQLNIQELETLKRYGIKVKVFIINNGILGNTKHHQRVNHMPEIACGPDGYSAPDFSEIAIAYGLRPFHINAKPQMDDVIDMVLAHDAPTICDVIHHDFFKYEPRISDWNVGIEDMYPFLPRDEFRANLVGIDPLPGWEEKK